MRQRAGLIHLLLAVGAMHLVPDHLFAAKPATSAPTEVPQFGVLEASFRHEGDYANPYWDLTASAELTGPNERTVTADLFWDGDRTWRFRYSPPTVGTWRWRTMSEDAGLDGKGGEFRCVASNRRGGVGPMRDYPFHFQHEDGTPYWLFGDTCWSVFGADPSKRFSRRTFEEYVTLRSRQKFNFVEGILTSPPSGNEGGPIFLDDRQRVLNPRFFQEADYRVAFLNRHGITAMLFLSWSNPQDYILCWRHFADQEARLKYAKYAISRYGAYNVAFGVTGEWHLEQQLLPQLEEIGRTLLHHNPHRRMIAIHSCPDPGSTREFNDRPWMGFGDFQQNYRNLHQTILQSRFRDASKQAPWPFAQRKPVVNGEYAYFLRDQDGDGKVDKPNSDSLEAIRRATYDIALGGGYFVTGFAATYWGGYRNPRAGFTLDDPLDDPWEQQVQHIHDLFTSLAWWRLTPSDHLVEALGGGPRMTAWCLAEPGRQYLVYVRGTAKAVVQLEEATAPYRVERFDPRTGGRISLGNADGGRREVDVPDTQDHVFLFTGCRP